MDTEQEAETASQGMGIESTQARHPTLSICIVESEPSVSRCFHAL